MNPEELDLDTAAMQAKYDQTLREQQSQLEKEDLSDMVAEHAAKQKVQFSNNTTYTRHTCLNESSPTANNMDPHLPSHKRPADQGPYFFLLVTPDKLQRAKFAGTLCNSRSRSL